MVQRRKVHVESPGLAALDLPGVSANDADPRSIDEVLGQPAGDASGDAFLDVEGHRVSVVGLIRELKRLAASRGGVVIADGRGDFGQNDGDDAVGRNSRRPPALAVEQPRGSDPQDPGQRLPHGDASVLLSHLQLRNEGGRDAAIDLASKGLAEPGLREATPGPRQPKAVLSVDDAHGTDASQRFISRQGGNLAAAVGSRVKQLRTAARLSLAAVASKVGMSAPRVLQLESGEAWSLKNLESFAAVFGVDPVELLGGAVLSDRESAVLAAMRSGDARAAMAAILAAIGDGDT